jgi:hypothetical protein
MHFLLFDNKFVFYSKERIETYQYSKKYKIWKNSAIIIYISKI